MSKLLDALKGLGPDGLREFVRTDAWQNQVTGFGTTRDKTTYSRFVGALPLDEWQLSDLYHGDAMAARMVDFVPDECTREGVLVNVDDDARVNAWIAERFEALNVLGNIADGERWGRCYGGAANILGADDGRPAWLPLVPERAASLSYLFQVDRRMLWPVSYYETPGHPKLGKPETYMVTPASHRAPMGIIHESRLILFGGAKTGLREKEMLNSWDYSVLQRAHEILAEYNTGWKSVSVMLTDAHQAVFKMAGLADAIASGSEEAVRARVRLFDMYRSNLRAMIIDAGDGQEGGVSEEFERQSISFENIPQTLDKLCLRLASTVPMPVTKLMGQSPAGMDATGESDFRGHYDELRAHQTQKLAPRVRRVVLTMLAAKDSPLKRPPKKIEITWPPFWKETPKEQAERRKALIDGDVQLVNAAIVPPQLVALGRLQSGGYDREITLTPELKTALEQSLKDDLGGDSGGTGGIELAPTDLAKIVKVNEARKLKGLEPVENGDLSIEAYNALQTSATTEIGKDQPTTAAEVKGAKEVEKPPPPAPFGGPPRAGGKPFGGPPKAGDEPPPDDKPEPPKPDDE